MYKFAERSISVKTLPCVLMWSTLQPSASRPELCGLPPKRPRAAPAAGGGSGARTPGRPPACCHGPASAARRGRTPLLNRYL